jgi:hypothetical protein
MNRITAPIVDKESIQKHFRTQELIGKLNIILLDQRISNIFPSKGII